jgi:hypothetical protein
MLRFSQPIPILQILQMVLKTCIKTTSRLLWLLILLCYMYIFKLYHNNWSLPMILYVFIWITAYSSTTAEMVSMDYLINTLARLWLWRGLGSNWLNHLTSTLWTLCWWSFVPRILKTSLKVGKLYGLIRTVKLYDIDLEVTTWSLCDAIRVRAVS